jgi:acetyltransferase-like isoleucine patch superfamily enzyme
LKNAITRSNIQVCDYTYYDDFDDPTAFEAKNVLYHFDFIGDRLIIGKFCAIASGVKFMMNGANHEVAPLTTYPFALFYNGWQMINEGQEIRFNTLMLLPYRAKAREYKHVTLKEILDDQIAGTPIEYQLLKRGMILYNAETGDYGTNRLSGIK